MNRSTASDSTAEISQRLVASAPPSELALERQLRATSLAEPYSAVDACALEVRGGPASALAGVTPSPSGCAKRYPLQQDECGSPLSPPAVPAECSSTPANGSMSSSTADSGSVLVSGCTSSSSHSVSSATGSRGGSVRRHMSAATHNHAAVAAALRSLRATNSRSNSFFDDDSSNPRYQVSQWILKNNVRLLLSSFPFSRPT